MRPVNRGAAPRAYATYQEAGPDLQARLGDYCSYCERQIETHLAVEHVQPKDTVPALRTVWTNFLLGCVHCNSSKGDTHVVLANFFWPETDNTLRALEYVPGGLVRPHPARTAPEQAMAQATIELTGLDKDPGHPNPQRQPSDSDRRWLRRQEVWEQALRHRTTLALADTANIRGLIVECAVARGLFSIWWTVFEGDADMRRRLREAFLNTEGLCFDPNENLVPHPTGRI